MLRASLRDNVLRVEGRLDAKGRHLILFDDPEQADEAMRRLGLWASRPLSEKLDELEEGVVDSLLESTHTLRKFVESVAAGFPQCGHLPGCEHQQARDVLAELDKRTTTIVHTHAEKRWVKAQLREHGPGEVMGRPELTLADALQLVDDCPTEFVPIGECAARDERGQCRGHRVAIPAGVNPREVAHFADQHAREAGAREFIVLDGGEG